MRSMKSALAISCAAVFVFSLAKAELPAPQPAVSIFEQLGAGPFAVEAADLNGDGHADLAIVNFDTDNLLIFFGRGDDTFRTNADLSFPVGVQPRALDIGDINGNGFNDIVVANAASRDLTIFFGDGTGEFFPEPVGSIAVGFGLVTVELADVNANGYLDILTTDFDGNAVQVLLNDGAGGFPSETWRRFPVGLGPLTIAVGDVNGNGILDLATGNFNSGDVTVLVGDGMGGFSEAPGSPFQNGREASVLGASAVLAHQSLLLPVGPDDVGMASVGVNPVRVKLVDVSGDGHLDIVTANFSSGDLSVLLGDGSGDFEVAPGSPFPVGLSPRDMTVVDVNGSGFLDAVVLSLEENSLFVMLGNGSGGFVAAPEGPFPVGEAPAGLVAADFSNNGVPAIATVNYASDNVSVLAGDGSGGFSPTLQSPLSFGSDPVDVALGDLTGNGKLDIVIARSALGDALMLYGDGSGQFSESSSMSMEVGKAPSAVLLADLNSDGIQDLVVVDYLADKLGLFFGDGQGAFSPAPVGTLSVGAAPRAVQAADLNGSGHLDLAVANYGSNDISVLLGDGSGGFTNAPGAPFAAGGTGPRGIAVGDLNANGILDIVSVNRRSNSISILLGDGEGGFALTGSPLAVGSEPVAVAIGDLSGNGILDIATANSGSDDVTILFGDGGGGFSAAPVSPLVAGSRPIVLSIGDLNADGSNDIVIGNFASDNLTVYFGNGTGDFSEADGSPVFLPGGGPNAIALADLDGDGRLDIVVVGDREGEFSEHVTVLTSDLVFKDRFEVRFLPVSSGLP